MRLKLRQRFHATPGLHPYPKSVEPAVILDRVGKGSLVFLGLIALVMALDLGKFLLGPIVGAVVVGLMLGPLVTRMERKGISAAVSALAALLVFLAILMALIGAIAAPATAWAERIPEMWTALTETANSLRQYIRTITDLGNQLRAAAGVDDNSLTVSVDTMGIGGLLTLAPPILGQIVLFIAALYFFLATRMRLRTAILSLCIGRPARCRAARIFRDVEHFVSRYLVAITVVNAGLGLATGLALALIGLPSPALWGALAMLLNYVPFVGPAVMALIVFAVGLVTFDSAIMMALPPLIVVGLHFIEAQFATPAVIGRTLTLNPLLVVLALAFWLWIWGPLGGFIAVPLLLIGHAVLLHILPRKAAAASRYATGPAGRPMRFKSGTATITAPARPAEPVLKPTGAEQPELAYSASASLRPS